MKLPEYICELLYRHNCVIVPGFGAFLTQRMPAMMPEGMSLFYPPQKRISFNVQIKENDGLLGNYISKSEGISYEKALAKINHFVSEINQELQTKGRVSLLEIGFFTINFEKNLIFEPLHTTNYLTESFGLTPFKVNTVQRIHNEVVLNETIDEVGEITVVSEVKEGIQDRRFPNLFKYAAAGLLFLSLSGVALKSYNNSQELEINKEVNQYLQSASFVFNVKEALPSINIEVESMPESVEEIFSNMKFHIIAGAFRNFENAQKKLSRLKREGYKATYIGENKYGLHQIAYSSYTNENEAINALKRLKKTENSAAWLLVTHK